MLSSKNISFKASSGSGRRITKVVNVYVKFLLEMASVADKHDTVRFLLQRWKAMIVCAYKVLRGLSSAGPSSQHKQECRRWATELHLMRDEVLFKQLPSQDECLICSLLLYFIMG